MTLLIGFLTFILVVNCLFLMLLVLVQLPKKEAGSGLAFGAGAVDTLIGAGSGNALTRMTKYSAGSFLGLALLLAVFNSQRHDSSSRTLQEELSRKATTAPMLPVAPPSTPASGQLDSTAPAVTPSTTAEGAPAINLTPNPALNPPSTSGDQADAPAAGTAQPTTPQ